MMLAHANCNYTVKHKKHTKNLSITK